MKRVPPSLTVIMRTTPRTTIVALSLAVLLLPAFAVAQSTSSAGRGLEDEPGPDDLNEYVEPAPPWDHPLSRDQWDGLQQLRQQDPTLEAQWEPSGVLTRLQGELGEPVQATEGTAMAYEFLQARPDLFMMEEPAEVLAPDRSQTDDMGWTHVRLQQTYKGIPVEGAHIAMHFDDERVPRIVNCSHVVADLSLSTTALVDGSTAVTTALQDIGVASASGPATKELVIYNHEGTAHLAWQVSMFVADPLGNFIYFVDARTGAVVDAYNNMHTILNREVWTANNLTVLPPNPGPTLVRANGAGATADLAVDAAYDNATTVWNYFNTNHARDSIDGAGLLIRSTVHYDVNYNNAFWNGSQMVYGDGDGTTFIELSRSLDVVAHELVHGITQYESALIYQNESGGLNESLSDIFGVLIDPADWQIGEDIYTPGTPGDALRDLSDPTCCNQPDHYSDLVTPDAGGSALDQACNSSQNQDNGCVHFNSGISNKATYLMWNGGTHHNITVAVIGAAKVSDIWYRAQTVYLTPSSTFADARQATINAATDLHAADVGSVRDAWAAVGVGVPKASTVPAVLAFGSVEFGSTRDLDLTLSNPGDADLIVSNVTVTTDFSLVTGTSFTVPAGGSSKITVRFTPPVASPGDRTGTLDITHNGASSPTSISLTGSGIFQLSTKAAGFGKPAPGGSETSTITLTNVAGAPAIDITSVVSTSPFFTTDWTNVANELGAGATTFDIVVTYTHLSPGRHTGQLLISFNPTIVINLAGGAPAAQSILGFHDGFTTTKTVLGVPFGAEYMTLLLAGIYGVYALRRRIRGT